jgi:hypothetical protein
MGILDIVGQEMQRTVQPCPLSIAFLGYAHDSRHNGSRGIVLLMLLGVFEF